MAMPADHLEQFCNAQYHKISARHFHPCLLWQNLSCKAEKQYSSGTLATREHDDFLQSSCDTHENILGLSVVLVFIDKYKKQRIPAANVFIPEKVEKNGIVNGPGTCA